MCMCAHPQSRDDRIVAEAHGECMAHTLMLYDKMSVFWVYR